jgi:copper chaperone CopZ
MKKVIKIDGMTCNHCKMRVEKALKTLGFEDVKVDLDKGIATIEGLLIEDKAIVEAIDEAGYEVVSIG